MNLREQTIRELRKERDLLAHLIEQFEAKSNLDSVDFEFHEEALKNIERNLRKLRKSKAGSLQ